MATTDDGVQLVAVMGEVVDEKQVIEHEDTENKDAASKKEHRRAQVRKAQIEHRQRKENHIKELEREVESLKKLIDQVQNQAHILKIENQVMQTQFNLATAQSQAAPPQPSHPSTSSTYKLQTPLAVHPLDAVASVALDPMLNVTALNLRRGHEVHVQPDGSAFVVEAGTNGQTALLNKPRTVIPQSTGTVVRREHQQITAELYAAHQDPDVATKAINFILALEHPCRTHFVPDLPEPCPGIPVPPDHVPSGHDMMASTALYRHAPLPVFQVMWSGSPMLGPDAGEPIDHHTTTPWTVPITSTTDDLMKLYGMSTSLPREDWEMTPVQVWFVLVQKLGLQTLLDEQVYEALKIKLGAYVRCFGFGTVITEMEFRDVVRDLLGVVV